MFSVIFPGQGSQIVGMGRDLYTKFDIVKRLFNQADETLRNACTEVTSADDSDVCNLGSINMGRIEDISEISEAVELATKFLICGTLKAKLPYEKVELTRARNRRLGLGLMGMH